MKKFVLGLICGVIIASGSAVYASDSIKALLFPATYEINGEKVELPKGYHTLNVGDRAYVPIRFVAESLDAFVAYEDKTKRISIETNFDLNKNGIRIGHLNVASNKNGSTIKGRLFVADDFWDKIVKSPTNVSGVVEPGAKINVGGRLLFFDEDGRYLGDSFISKEMIAKGEQINSFEVTSKDQLSNYAYVMLADEFPQPRTMPWPADIDFYDPTDRVGVGGVRVHEDNGFSVVNGYITLNVDGHYRAHIHLSFLDEKGNEIGTSELVSELQGKSPGMIINKFETAGKGNLTNFKDVKITIQSLTPINK